MLLQNNDPSKLLVINKLDNVGVDLASGHKYALCDIQTGKNIIKYGQPIGHATENIASGAHVHSHNMKTNLSGKLEYTYVPGEMMRETCESDRTFMGYVRENGDVGIRNDIWIINTVGCVNKIAEKLAALTGAKSFPHPFGCSQLGDDQVTTQAILKGMVNHPNAGGVLVLGLGCENNQVASLQEVIGEWNEERVRFLVAQSVEDEVEAGVAICRELVEKMREDRREPLPLSLLRVGLKCGGSDGLSGITANPLVGAFSDWLIAQGGTTILTEVPEMFGAETILMNRAVNEQVFDDTVQLINNFKEYFRSCDQPIYENPSPGNKQGGITTLEEKSLGCVQKGGYQPVVGVLDYCQRAERRGLNLLKAPGNDLVATSALALSGCQLVLFTTGRGTPFGSFVPTMKLSTNTPLAQFKSNWIDFDAGVLLGGVTQQEALRRLIDKVLSTANGEHLKHEQAGFKELAIFKSGVTL